MMLLGSIVCGFILDLLIGDPHGWPHPICLIGNLIGWLEKGCGPWPGKIPGACCAAGSSSSW